ncbi:MAG TPA: glycosyltransferase family 4 protein [Methylomirabilota bacterium]|nr:glycosyltransferase family 4 protein [Methylomirabilota bacterium]
MDSDFKDIDVIAPNLHRRYSGVTSTIVALVPEQAKRVRIASVGTNLPPHVPRVRFWRVVLRGWTLPASGRPRVWHARRNDEMIVGLILRHFLFQPWKLVFTSAAQRRHSRFTRFLIRRMDAVIATSEAAASYLERPATVIPHGVDLMRFQPPADKEQAWRESGLPGRFGVGVFGRVRQQKGTDLFIEAMMRLLPRHPDWTAVITGLEAREEEAFVAGLKRRVADAELEHRIFMLGQRPREEMARWFQRVSLYVAPMRWEGFGLTPLEAMASGAAVVATRTGAAPLLVADGETGILIPPNDQEAMVGAIERFLADPDLAHRQGAAGRLKAVKEHDLTREAASINAVYERVRGLL